MDGKLNLLELWMLDEYDIRTKGNSQLADFALFNNNIQMAIKIIK